ncbi:MAG: class I SAM-dependent rRNA methyltransferase, partial [Planctomycetota bacterium]
VDGPKQRGLVHVVADDGKHVGWADYNPKAPVRGRVLTRDEEWPGDFAFISQRVQQALWRRIGLGMQPQGNGLRLINGEGDGLSGVVVDVFGGTLVIDLYSAGMRDRAEMIGGVLRQFLADLKQVAHMGEDAAGREGCEPLASEAVQVSFAENGVLFRFALDASQKGGWYLDQRDNRRLVAQYARDRRVLDLFSYHGGFALCALAAGAQSADAVESSAAAVAAISANADHNGFPLTIHQNDVFDWLEERGDGSTTFDLIVCDPPKLAPRRRDKQKGLKAYRFLIDRCLRMLAPNGILLVCSCSQIIGTEDLRKLLLQQAAKRRNELDVVGITGQPADHPWPVAFTTGRYLSGVFVHLRPHAGGAG